MPSAKEKPMEELLKKLPPVLAEEIWRACRETGAGESPSEPEEIHLTAGRPVRLKEAGRERALSYVVSQPELERIFAGLLEHSVYARQEELSKGFLTLRGGNRVGVCGRTVLENGTVHTVRELSSLNLRRAKAFPGMAAGIAPALLAPGGRPYSTLIVSPPGCGKTTLLRDLIRCFSEAGFRVGLCDERSEVAGSWRGIPSFDVGPSTDVLDGCPKGEGMVMLLRSMGPDIIAADEIGREEDLAAAETILCAGVSLLVTLHGSGYEDALRSRIGPLVRQGGFQRILVLSNRPAIGTVSGILNGDGQPADWRGRLITPAPEHAGAGMQERGCL